MIWTHRGTGGPSGEASFVDKRLLTRAANKRTSKRTRSGDERDRRKGAA